MELLSWVFTWGENIWKAAEVYFCTRQNCPLTQCIVDNIAVLWHSNPCLWEERLCEDHLAIVVPKPCAFYFIVFNNFFFWFSTASGINKSYAASLIGHNLCSLHHFFSHPNKIKSKAWKCLERLLQCSLLFLGKQKGKKTSIFLPSTQCLLRNVWSPNWIFRIQSLPQALQILHPHEI